MSREDIMYSSKGIFQSNSKSYLKMNFEDSEDELESLDKPKNSSDE